jgi:hypothetical protein
MLSDQLISDSVTFGVLIIALVGAVALSGFAPVDKGLQREDKQLTILMCVGFLALIAVVFGGFLDVSLKFSGTPDIRADVVSAIRTAVGVACGVTFGFFAISLFVLKKDPSRTQSFTSMMMYLSFLMAFVSMSIMAIQQSPA